MMVIMIFIPFLLLEDSAKNYLHPSDDYPIRFTTDRKSILYTSAMEPYRGLPPEILFGGFRKGSCNPLQTPY
jgi:hypothetical protein